MWAISSYFGDSTNYQESSKKYSDRWWYSAESFKGMKLFFCGIHTFHELHIFLKQISWIPKDFKRYTCPEKDDPSSKTNLWPTTLLLLFQKVF